MNSILSIENVVKRYNGTTAVDRISLEIPKQTIFGLLGPNGAGKTSLIRMITQIMTNAFEHLDAPVRRVAAKNSPIPYNWFLEEVILPQDQDIINALEELAKY